MVWRVALRDMMTWWVVFGGLAWRSVGRSWWGICSGRWGRYCGCVLFRCRRRGFFELGMDSLMAVELRNRLNGVFRGVFVVSEHGGV